MFRILSDLHLEFHNFKLLIKQINDLPFVENLIIAGDLINYKNKLLLDDFFNNIKNNYKKIIYVLGNHEFYGINPDDYSSVVNEYHDICDKHEVILLNDEIMVIDGLKIFGGTMWSNIDIETSKVMYGKHKYIKYRDETLKRHHDTINKINTANCDIIVTHHLPSYKLIDPKYIIYSNINSGFASDCDYLIKEPIKYWIFGHTHTRIDKYINGVRMICNPLGYPGENTFKDYILKI